MKRNYKSNILAISLFLALSVAASAAPGDLDPTFGNGGKLIDGITRADENAYDIAIQQDGKIVAAAGAAVTRYNPDGSLDQSFGSGGKVFTRTYFSAIKAINVAVWSVAIQADGKIIAAGESDGRFALVRLDPDGTLDTSFGVGGIVTTLIISAQNYACANSVIVQPDGKIIAAGSMRNRNSDRNDGFVLVRYNADGSLDQSFGNSGVVVTTVGSGSSLASSVALQPDHKLVAVGQANWDFAAVRYNADGSLDQSFGVAGRVITAVSSRPDAAGSVAIQSDGKIVAAGSVSLDPVGLDQTLVRYNADGSLDATFGNGGITRTTVTGGGSGDSGVLIQADGKIIATSSLDAFFTLTRYTPGGSLDISFGTGGIVSLQNIGGRSYAAAQQADGRIVAAGHFYDSTGFDLALVRCNTDGSLDPSFDSDGMVRTDFGFFSGNRLYDVATQPDGKIVAAAVGNSVIRYNPEGSRDTSFNGTGYVTAGSTGGPTHIAVAVQPDGKTIFAAMTYVGDTYDMWFDIVRYNSDGSPDLTFGDDTTYGDSGMVNLPATGGDWSNASWVHIQPDGKIIVGGGDYIYRLNPNGSLDAAFGGGDGIANVPLYAYASAIQHNGKIVIAGPRWNGSVSNSTHDLVVARLDPDGATDSTFGSGGVVTIPMSIGISREIAARTVAIQTDGKILAGGYRLVRLTENGSLDTRFGNGGIVTPPMESFREVVIQSDGKLVIAGTSNNDFAIARYNPNGSLDTTFGGGAGVTTVDFNNSNDTAYGMALDAQGRAVIVGEASGAFAIARFLNDSLVPQPIRVQFDFDGDARSDISVFRPSDRVWYLNQSTGGFSATQFGLSSDILTPADFDGDGKTDMAVFRDGTWYWLGSLNGNFNAVQFGQTGDVPQPADYTGDGCAELAVYRGGVWFTLNLSNNQFDAVQFGLSTDKPVASDYDGDGRADTAVYRNGVWYLLRSTQGFAAIQFGLATDKLVPADYDGDGKTDLAVYRDGVWYQLRSSQGLTAFQFGVSTDIPAPADYDGDGRADAAVYRDGAWYLLQTTNGFAAMQFGLTSDKPVPTAYLP